MNDAIDKDLLESYSRGEVTRREIEDRLDRPVSFGTLLRLLGEHGLRLPQIASDPNSPGIRLIRDLALRAKQRG